MTSKMNRAGKMMRLLGATAGLFLLAGALYAQGNFGRILGTVTDQTGAILAGAVVSVIDTQRGVARTVVTDSAGAYDAPNLTPSTYTVKVEMKGFKVLDRPNIELGVGKELRVDLTPQPGEQSQTVVVEATAPLVDAASATLGGSLGNADINDLPLNGRNFQSLMGLRPGVMLQPGGSPWTQSTNNVRPDETSWMVDGILNANAFDSRPVFLNKLAQWWLCPLIKPGITIIPFRSNTSSATGLVGRLCIGPIPRILSPSMRIQPFRITSRLGLTVIM